MAQRRMLSLKVIDTDEFLDMPQSSQFLYFNLSIRADDDGFVSNPKKIMRMVGCNDDDIKVLIAKSFVIPFKSGVCVIRHWRIHNYIQKDRYEETRYLEEKSTLLEEKGIYKNKDEVKCIQNVSKLYPQDRLELGKVRLEIDSGEQVAAPPIFSLKDEIKKLEDNPRRDLNIIAFYLEQRMPDIESPAQLQVLIKRHLRAAGELKVFSDNQIIAAAKKAKVEYKDIDWTLETLGKILTK